MALRRLGDAPRAQAAARALAVALLALGAVQPAGAARLFGEQGDNQSESQTGAALGVAGAAVGCGTKLVTDGAKCGFDSIKNWVEDANACGWSTCTRRAFGRDVHFPCPKRCEQTESRARTCEIKGECGYVVRVHLTGHLYVGTYDNMTISLDYVDHELVDGAPEVRMIINAEKNGNGDRIRNMIKGIVEKAKVEANEKLKSFKDSFKQRAADKVSSAMDTQAIEKDAGANSSEAAQAMRETITSLLGTAEIEFLREEIKGSLEAYWAGSKKILPEPKCERSLILEYDNKDRINRKANKLTYRKWPESPIAMKHIPQHDCVKKYFANCTTLDLEITTMCKGEITSEEKRCIGGFGCLKASEKVPVWNGEMLDLYLPDGPVRLLSGAAFFDTKRKEAEKEYGNMTALVTIPGFGEDFSKRLCTSIVKRKWWIVGWPAQEVAWRSCAGVVGMFLDATFKRNVILPTPQDMDTHGMTPSVIAEFRGSNLTVNVRTVPWQGLAEYLQQTLVNRGKDMKPAKLIRSNVVLVPEKHHLRLGEGTWIDVQGSVDVGR